MTKGIDMKHIFKSMVALTLLSGVSFAKNAQDYDINLQKCKHYVDLARQEAKKGNLNLARAYAKKAVQQNPWEKLAWANYDDIIQKLADEGDIEDFGTVLEESKSDSKPKAPKEEVQFEGC